MARGGSSRAVDSKGISIIEEGKRKLEAPKAGKWLAQGRVAGKYVLVRYVELPDKLVVINIGQTTRRVL